MVTKEDMARARGALQHLLYCASGDLDEADLSGLHQAESEIESLINQSQPVPEKISDYGYPDYGEIWSFYATGWNDCIDEMLASAPKQSQPVPEGYVLVPERLVEPGDREGASLIRIGFRDGWNACRAEMLSAVPKRGGDQ